jgi:tRNA (guanine37-N1)-methyltransferase
MQIDVITLFPGMFEGVLSESILGRARDKGLLDVRIHQLRDYSTDRHHKVDDRPYGGGPGMVLRPEPVFGAVRDIDARFESARRGRRFLLCPQGRPFRADLAAELASVEGILLVCGRYEGFDERIRHGLELEELSIGDYVLSGGELAAMVVIDAVARLVPGVLGNEDSPARESFVDDRLDFPQYTRPVEFEGRRVPEILLSGDHEQIRRWRESQAFRKTYDRRRDLFSEGECRDDALIP